MTPKLSSFLFIIFILSQLLHANSSQYSTFGSIKRLQDSRKGDEIEGLNHVKNYLKRFGYIKGDVNPNSDYFDDVLESAIKTYQSFHCLNSSGVLDIETLALMGKPRCRMPDIVNNYGHDHNHNHNHNDNNTLDDLKFAFYPGELRWTASQKYLRVSHSKALPSNFGLTIERALVSWSKHSRFTFLITDDYDNANIQFDMRPIDGQYNAVARAFDSAEKWYTSYQGHLTTDKLDLYSVALHEIGHALGLGHSEDKYAVMYPVLVYGHTKELNADDIAGITELYKDEK